MGCEGDTVDEGGGFDLYNPYKIEFGFFYSARCGPLPSLTRICSRKTGEAYIAINLQERANRIKLKLITPRLRSMCNVFNS